jgi:nudix-type nucleoside diphosphatase (YffH/AdpP family)
MSDTGFVRACLMGADLRLAPNEAAALAHDIAALEGQVSVAQVQARLNVMAVRACARVRAAQESGAQTPMQVTLHAQRQAYAAFFAVEEYDLTHSRFDGTQSDVLRRAVFVSGDAVTVLPYDPIRRRVLLVQQFRTGPMARGDQNPWQYEAIAGRIDAGETPEAAARREASEEAGLTLGALHFVAGYYPSPGILSEYLYSYVAICDLPDSANGTFGLAGEGEDIKAHVMDVGSFFAGITAGGQQGGNAPLILTALWLLQNQHRLV